MKVVYVWTLRTNSICFQQIICDLSTGNDLAMASQLNKMNLNELKCIIVAKLKYKQTETNFYVFNVTRAVVVLAHSSISHCFQYVVRLHYICLHIRNIAQQEINHIFCCYSFARSGYSSNENCLGLVG